MIDTVKLWSPWLSHEAADAVSRFLFHTSKINCATGESEFELTAGELEGSWDSKIRIVLRYERPVSRVIPAQDVVSAKNARLKLGERKSIVVTEWLPSPPWLEIECSVHKLILGHNIEGGPEDFGQAMAWLVRYLGAALNVRLPAAWCWQVQRVDWAEVYKLPCEAIQEFMFGLRLCEFPRRLGKVVRYDTSVSAPGSSTMCKLYHKGPEVYKHERKRLIKHVGMEQYLELQNVAHERLRTEVGIKAPKLKRDFGHSPFVYEITSEYLRSVHDAEIARLLREGKSTMHTVRTHQDVLSRLQEVYKPELAGRLFGTWLQLATMGEGKVRRSMTKTSFYRQRNQLQEAGCAWLGSDIYVRPSSLPIDFSPVRSDPRRVTGEHPVIAVQYAQMRLAA